MFDGWRPVVQLRSLLKSYLHPQEDQLGLSMLTKEQVQALSTKEEDMLDEDED